MVPSGTVGVIRSYSIAASTVKDRTRAISLNSGALAIGMMAGPGSFSSVVNCSALQLLFIPIGFPGWLIVGRLALNMYTAPAVLSLLGNLVAIVVIQRFFKESSVGIETVKHVETGLSRKKIGKIRRASALLRAAEVRSSCRPHLHLRPFCLHVRLHQPRNVSVTAKEAVGSSLHTP